MADRGSWCIVCGAAPGEDCTYANDGADVKRGDPRPGLHFYRGGLVGQPAVLIPDEPPFASLPSSGSGRGTGK